MPQTKKQFCKQCLNPIPKEKRKDSKFCSVSCRTKNRRSRNRIKTNQYHRKYYSTKKKDSKWYEKHKAKRKKSYYNHREREIQASTEWYKRNKSRVLEVRRRSYPKRKEERELLKLEVFSIYSKKISNSEIPCCACCGENSHIEFLALDHVKNRKSVGHKRNVDTGHRLRLWAKKNGYPNTLQVLCHNCNTAKGENGICPHKQ